MSQDNNEGISLREEVRKRGATDVQLTSKIFKLAEKAVAEGCVDGIETASDLMSEVKDGIASAKNVAKRLERATASAEKAIHSINTAANSTIINDAHLMDAVNVYTLILSRTKEILGEDRLTEDVIVQLLETASYGLWRSVMGPKDGKMSPKDGNGLTKVRKAESSGSALPSGWQRV